MPYVDCCRPLHRSGGGAPTAERLMRSRYSAFVLREAAYLLATWHPSTRPAALELDAGVRWTGLEVLTVRGGSELGEEGTVEFRAHCVVDGLPRVQHERGRFLRSGGQWLYVGGVFLG